MYAKAMFSSLEYMPMQCIGLGKGDKQTFPLSSSTKKESSEKLA